MHMKALLTGFHVQYRLSQDTIGFKFKYVPVQLELFPPPVKLPVHATLYSNQNEFGDDLGRI